MISILRGLSNSKLAGVLVGIIIIPFVFWGMGSVFSGGNTNNVAKINNEAISSKDFVNFINESRLTNDIIKANIDKNIIEQIEGIFGRQPQAYIFRLINDGLNEISAKCKSYKTSRTTDLEKFKRWYDLHNSVIDITKVEIKDSDGRYVRIPKLVDSHKLLKDDTESSESTLK